MQLEKYGDKKRIGPEQNNQELVASDLANKTTSTAVSDQFVSVAETEMEKTDPVVSHSVAKTTPLDSKGESVKATAPAQPGNNSGMTQTGPVSLSDSRIEVESKTRHAETQAGSKETPVEGNTKVPSVERDAKVTSKEAGLDHKRGDASHRTEKNADVTTCVKNLQKAVSDGSGDAVKSGSDASTNNIPIANQNNSKGGGLLASAGVDDRPDNCDKKAPTSAFDVVDANKSFNNKSTSTVSHFV